MNHDDVERLWRRRPRSRLLRASAVVLGTLAVYAWTCGDVALADLFAARRLANVERFVTHELAPHPLRGRPFELAAFWDWARGILLDPDRRPLAATLATLSISVLAICLAGLAGAACAPFAARNLATVEPFVWGTAAAAGAGRARRRARDRAWRVASTSMRGFLIVVRALPEYVWAFLLLAMLGPSAWPAVLALAIHNAGILGKLGGETIENLDHAPLRALRLLGATRAQIGAAALVPLSLSRYLLYFFYRFETCVREATVLGMLGVVSLGYWIQDARSRHYYDELWLLVALGAAIVLAADLVSALARAVLRRAA